MIEVVYTPKEKNRENDSIRLPKNIKQVGDIKNSKKIYIEDYAINYMKELHLSQKENTVGILLGRMQKSGVDRYIFIKGAILAKNVFASESEISFSDNDWNEIYECMEKYFPDCEITGWFVSTTNINAALFRTLRKVHMNYFPGNDKTMFLFDYEEKMGFFYIFENNQLVKQKGYTIYYERNEEMQEYMVDQREVRKVTDQEIEKEISSYNKIKETSPSYREQLSGTLERGNRTGRKQAFMNYCANVAMVVLILFIGMYVLDDKINLTGKKQSESEPMTLTNVIKVDGKVYPTVEETSVQETPTKEPLIQETGLWKESESATEESKSSSVIVVEQPVVQTQEETQAATAASIVSYREHKVEKGEKLITICKKYYGDASRLDEIMKLNNIEDVDKIYIGQIIKLP